MAIQCLLPASISRLPRSVVVKMSRCKADRNYEPSRIIITDSKAEQMLQTAIMNSQIFKSPSDFVLGKDTFYVESFNNTMNIFHDKRIAYGSLEYNTRCHVSVLHWNENDRDHTSIYQPALANSQGLRK